MTTTADRILDSAQTLVQVRGYNGFSYADISAELSITKPSIHHHFPTKAALAEALIARYRERFAVARKEVDDDAAGARSAWWVMPGCTPRPLPKAAASASAASSPWMRRACPFRYGRRRTRSSPISGSGWPRDGRGRHARHPDRCGGRGLPGVPGGGAAPGPRSRAAGRRRRTGSGCWSGRWRRPWSTPCSENAPPKAAARGTAAPLRMTNQPSN